MAVIEAVELADYSLPLRTALKWGAGHKMARLEHLLVRVRLSDGAMGLAECNPRPTIYGETPESVRSVMERFIRPALVGEALDTVEDIARVQAGYALLKANNSVQAAVDMALWDALASSRGVTLGALLGATRERVHVSYILGQGERADVLAEARGVYEGGVRMLKVKIGRDLRVELDTVRAIRAELPDMNFYLDANETLDAETAPDVLAAFAEAGGWYCEEPLPIEQMTARARLRQVSALPVIGDDSCFTPRDLKRELEVDTFDVLNIKPARTGFSLSRGMIEAAVGAGKRVMTGSQASSILGCVHTLLLAALPGVSEPSEGTYWMQVATEDALSLEDGYVRQRELMDTLRDVKARLLAAYF